MTPDSRRRTGRVLAAASVCALILIAPVRGFAADAAAPADSAAPPAHARANHDRGIEARITSLHDQLQITPDQEAQWAGIAQALRDSAAAARGANAGRRGGSRNAVETLRAQQAAAAARAEGLKTVLTAFEPFYASLPEAQQKRADTAFSHHRGPRTTTP
ncbi:MAG: Spy/CpxP family protein refolding chaperone [Azospirillaceae bacterium]|nr:Spy/CpxP family protein refolding chaperone [Azospirillaceae bacterium]